MDRPYARSMQDTPQSPGSAENVVEAYARRYRPGMIDLSAPSPTPSPVHLTSAVLASVDLAFSTPGGSLALREAVARRYETLTAADVLITSGGSEALAALAASVSGPGRRIALSDGTYTSFVEVARVAGAHLIQDVVGQEGPWPRASRVHAMLATNPSVPDGRRIDVPRLLDRARRAGAIAIVDEVYRSIALEGEAPVAAADLDGTAVSVGDLTKPLGLGGLRIGWIATRNTEVGAAAARWLGLLTGGPSALSEVAALHALGSFDTRVETHASDARANAPGVYAVLREAGWTFEEPQLGLTLWATPPWPLGQREIDALDAHGMFLVRGETLGRSGGVRIGLLTRVDHLRTALEVIAAARPRDVVTVLMRVPRPGFGKSRLAASIGLAEAHLIARALVEDTTRLASEGPWRTLAAFTPAHDVTEARALLPGTDLVPQVEGDLGARILGALNEALRDADRAVLIGSDTPDLPTAMIEQALAALDQSDLVLGPARDGGFVLIGLRETHHALFDGVVWSTSTVCERIVNNAGALGWRVTIVDEWEDVDDLASQVGDDITDSGKSDADNGGRAGAVDEVVDTAGLEPAFQPDIAVIGLRHAVDVVRELPA